MKIPYSIRNTYDEQHEINSILKKHVDKKIKSLIDKRWHYDSRLKMPESFALKVESGRIKNPNSLEDFFACTIVVENITTIKKAEKIIKNYFNLEARRPPKDKFTHKNSDSFPFDDLRLYVKWKDDPILPPTEIKDILFEVQIKTFLQHAWTIATHDLTYKTDDINWARERIAYQIKAMLEHAEMSIQEAEKLASSQALKKVNKRIEKSLKIINLIKEKWEKTDLPENIVLLADNIRKLLKSINISHDRLKDILDQESKNGRGVKTRNLSPYGIIIQSLFNREQKTIIKFLSYESDEFKILIPQEIELPNKVKKSSLKNAIFV